jgi:hypothetical protein
MIYVIGTRSVVFDNNSHDNNYSDVNSAAVNYACSNLVSCTYQIQKLRQLSRKRDWNFYFKFLFNQVRLEFLFQIYN